MIKENKNAKRPKTLNNLEKDIIEKEKELNALKKAFELNDLKALNILPVKYIPKTKRPSIKIPKALNDEINEKRKELKKLKEIEELDKIQMTLFKNIKTNRKKNYKLNPISQRMHSTEKNYCKTEDFFANNLNKECEKIFGNKPRNNSRNLNLYNTANNTEWKKNNKVKKFDATNYKTKYINNFGKEINDIKEIINKKNDNNDKDMNIDSDEEKDRDFLNNLDRNLKIFYLSKTQKIFEFLKSINLCRYIHHFLTEGIDLFEEFIELPKDFFEKKSNPFLNRKQIEKLYKKISSYKNINTNTNNNIPKTKTINESGCGTAKTKTINEAGCGTDTIIEKNIGGPTPIPSPPKIKIDNSSNFSVNNSTLLINCTEEELLRCWHCLKPLKKENAILREYNNDLEENDNSVIFKYKYFCSDNCVNFFEDEKNVKKINENNFIQNEDEIHNNNINDDINNINDNKSDDNNEEDYYEGDNYDPMEDF